MCFLNFSSLSWFCGLRASSFNSGPCVGVKPAGGMGHFLGPKLQDEIESGSKCGACPRIIIGTIVNPHITGSSTRLCSQHHVLAHRLWDIFRFRMKPMKGIRRYRLGYRLRTPAFYQKSVSDHGLQ